MNRRAFLVLGFGASALAVAGAGLARLGGRDGALAIWLQRHRAGLPDSEADPVRLVAHIRRTELAESLRELDELTDGPLRCVGNEVSGRAGELAFTLELRVS